jgi:UDP-N-acetyl-D-glucosamine dehydrogenase
VHVESNRLQPWLRYQLLALGAEVRAADPNVLEGRVDRRVVRVDAVPKEVAAADAVVLLTDHRDFDFEMIKNRAKYILDTRHRIAASENVEYL